MWSRHIAIKLRNSLFPQNEKMLSSLYIPTESITFFMTLSIQNELQLFTEKFPRHMSSYILDKLAREIGFVQQENKY